jgi:hypothetical protein
MKPLLLFFLAASSLHFEITDARGKKPGGVSVEAGTADAEGWCALNTTSKGKSEPILIWPFDGRAKAPDGPEAIPVIVVEKGDSRAAANPRVVAALVAGRLLGVNHDIGIDMSRAEAGLTSADEAFAKGVGLLAARRYADAIDPLGRALKERERQLTRFPSEIYPLAMLYGRALFAAGKFDDSAVAFLKAVNLRPSDVAARRARAEALIKAGKPEAAESIQ